jgi:hypothetical protein
VSPAFCVLHSTFVILIFARRDYGALGALKRQPFPGVRFGRIRACTDCAGIVAKRKDLPYESGRSRRWLKIKNPNSSAMERVRDQTF